LLTLLFFLLLALLVPVALYCLALALVNRRANPLMVHGVWDCAFLLFAGSGLLLVVGPAVLNLLYAKAVDNALQNGQGLPEALTDIWAGYWGLTLAYYAALVLGIALILWLRRDKTVIYNVDPDKFDGVLGQTLARLGLSAMRSGNQVRIGGQRLPATGADSDIDHEPGFFAAVLDVDTFAPLANVTLHWRNWHDPQRSAMRRLIEEELARNLDDAARTDNPAVTWLLGIATALFGLLFLATLLLILLSPRRWG
jgi:hypothetical protein